MPSLLPLWVFQSVSFSRELSAPYRFRGRAPRWRADTAPAAAWVWTRCSKQLLLLLGKGWPFQRSGCGLQGAFPFPWLQNQGHGKTAKKHSPGFFLHEFIKQISLMLTTGVSTGNPAIHNRAKVFHAGGIEEPRKEAIKTLVLSLHCVVEYSGEL